MTFIVFFKVFSAPPGRLFCFSEFDFFGFEQIIFHVRLIETPPVVYTTCFKIFSFKKKKMFHRKNVSSVGKTEGTFF